MSKLNKSSFTAILFALIFIGACRQEFEIIKDLQKSEYQLLDIDSNKVFFPEIINDKVSVAGYIFTNCPDICPLTTNNMRLIQEKLNPQYKDQIEFVSISFDPEVDRPEVLRKFAEIRDLDLSNWNFLTGDKAVIDELMKEVGVLAFVGDSTTFSDGSKTYYYTHTDRIQLIDEDGRIRKNYKGSEINIDEIVNDVKYLID
jgi:protein SCO1/2